MVREHRADHWLSRWDWTSSGAIPSAALFLVATFGHPLSAQSPDTQLVRVSLPAGISLAIPAGWRPNRPDVQAAFSGRSRDTLDLSHIQPDPTGSLVLFAAPFERPEEASIQISIMPTRVSQAMVSTFSASDIADADQQFRSEIEGTIERLGLTLLEWRGTTRVPLGGQVALLSRYRFRYPEKTPMLMESYGIYLGSRAIHIRIQYSESASTPTVRDVDRVRRSIQLARSNL